LPAAVVAVAAVPVAVRPGVALRGDRPVARAAAMAAPAFSPDVCPQGYALDQRRRVCVRAHAGILPDEDLYQQGRALALSGFYGQALLILDAVSRTDDSMVYTMRGYATRKLGSFAAGMELYQKALAIDPNNINTHEYIGEGYVSAGRVDRARVDWPNSKPYAAFIANNMRTLRKQ
jgi:tetratricopeptide (TPR) repeat protein